MPNLTLNFPPILGDTWVMAQPYVERRFRCWSVSVRNYERKRGAGGGDRTRDVQLGKLAFYR
jgi:hypothetical protein